MSEIQLRYMEFNYTTIAFKWPYEYAYYMGNQVTTVLDEDLYDKVTDQHDETGKSKSEIVNDKVRDGFNGDEPSLADSIMPVFGQSLFVAGFVVALLSEFLGGIAIALLGLGLMIGAKVDEYMVKHEVPATTALIKVLGA